MHCSTDDRTARFATQVPPHLGGRSAAAPPRLLSEAGGASARLPSGDQAPSAGDDDPRSLGGGTAIGVPNHSVGQGACKHCMGVHGALCGQCAEGCGSNGRWVVAAGTSAITPASSVAAQVARQAATQQCLGCKEGSPCPLPLAVPWVGGVTSRYTPAGRRVRVTIGGPGLQKVWDGGLTQGSQRYLLQLWAGHHFIHMPNHACQHHSSMHICGHLPFLLCSSPLTRPASEW